MLSDKQKQNLLLAALTKEYGLKAEVPKPKSLTIEEVIEDRVIYNIDGQLYETNFEMVDGDARFTDPKKVTSTKIFTQEALSVENRRSLLDAALTAHLGLGAEEWVYIEDFSETYVIYNQDRQSYRSSYTVEGESVTFGTPEKVTREVTYKAMEALQETYSEIIQEAGKRNAVRDAARVKKILELCQELLSSETPDEAGAQKASKEAVKVLAWIKTLEVQKTEDGVQFPAAAYAYAPEADNPSGWMLRIWEDTTKKVTRAQLGRASAYLSPGGYRGKKVAILEADLASVKRKFREEYRKLDVDEDSIPRWVKETETRELVREFTSLKEAKFDKGKAAVIVIKPGFNATEDRYYPAEMLKRDYEIFEGQKMYADHPTEAEDEARPERSIKDWVATLVDVTVDEAGVVSGVAEIIEPWMMQKLAALRDKEMLSEMGISINAVGSASKGTIDGKETLVIEKLVAARSVDFVTEPGAGGEVTLYESDRNRDIDLIEISGLRERRPDLVSIIETEVRKETTEEVKKLMEDKEKITELEATVTTLTTENDGLKATAAKEAEEKAKAEAQATIKEAIEKAELPQASKDVLLARFADAKTAEGIEEAITSEIDYIAKLSEAGKVKKLGVTQPDAEKSQAALRESFKKAHPEWTDEQLETAVTGR